MAIGSGCDGGRRNRGKGWTVIVRIGSLLAALALLAAWVPARGETRQGGVPVIAPGQRAETLRLQIQSLEREKRLRDRAATLIQDQSLFDEYAGRGRRVVATQRKADTEGLLAREETEITVGHEIGGIGGEQAGTLDLERELEEVKAEIQRLRSIENCELRIAK